MAIKIGANLAYTGKLPNFERDSFETKAAMKAFDENSIDEGHLSYCKEDGNIYQYKHTNTADATTGRWRIFKTDIVADAELNGTSTNPIQNKAVFEALKAKADVVALGAYQPKYNADYVATKNFNYSELPDDVRVVDLNGYVMSIEDSSDAITIDNKEFYNGIIYMNHNNVSFSDSIFFNSFINSILEFHVNTSTFYYCRIATASIDDDTICYFCKLDFSTINTSHALMCCIADGCDYNAVDIGSEPIAYCSYLSDKYYINAIIVDGHLAEYNFETDVDNPVVKGNAPSCEAVKTALQLKADKTQLNNYVTTATANTTYAKKSDISNIYKFKGTKTNYADLPTTNRVTGDVWNITNADAEHGIKAGDNVAWNGTAWDNLSGTVDLSAYATKEKAFTKDTVSTEPGQVVAGPPTTQGNLYLRKLIADDIPNLESKYQKLDNNGCQQHPKIIKASIGPSSEQLYLVAHVNTTNNYKSSPDWYYATDGTLQDIKTKIPKVVLDDTVSTTSGNGVKNSVITKYVDSKVTTINSSIADIRSSLESTQIDFVDLRNKVKAMPKTVFITQAAYNALTTKDANTIYYING